MPRPARQEVHRHFTPIAIGSPAPPTQGAEATDPAESLKEGQQTDTPDGKQPKHPRVQCKHCFWKSKRDASRQAKHLESCQPYRSWAEAHGEPVIGSEEAQRVALEERQARRRKSSMPADVDKANFFAAPVASSAPGPTPALHDARIASAHTSPTKSHHNTSSVPPPPVMRPPSNPAHPASAQWGAAGVHGGGVQGLGDAERRRLDLLYARALVAEGTDAEGKPHDLYDRQKHPQMWAFLKALNPGYEPPSREVLGNMVMREFFGSSAGSAPTVGGASPPIN